MRGDIVSDDRRRSKQKIWVSHLCDMIEKREGTDTLCFHGIASTESTVYFQDFGCLHGIPLQKSNLENPNPKCQCPFKKTLRKNNDKETEEMLMRKYLQVKCTDIVFDLNVWQSVV